MAKPSLCSWDGSSIEERIQRARELYAQFRHSLLCSSQILELLDNLRQNVDATQKLMHTVGLVEECRKCDVEGGGSCCGAGIEGKYDVVLLLTNLLLGVSLPDERFDKNSCYFLGNQGCVLRSRHVLCVNYICGRLKEALSSDNIIKVQRVAGSELDCSFLLHESIKAFLNSDIRAQSLPNQNALPSHQLL